MATVAARAPKRELAPDWRDALRESARRLAVRTWGVLLLAVSVSGAVALASHNPTDPSLSTAAGGPPTNWLGSTGAYASDALLLLFGIGAVLFLPVIAIAGLRMVRLEPGAIDLLFALLRRACEEVDGRQVIAIAEGQSRLRPLAAVRASGRNDRSRRIRDGDRRA